LPLEFGEDRHRAPLRRQPPRVGEHTREILLSAGLADDRIEALHRAGVLIDAASPAQLQQTS
jgi:crotonobetainyl-CoA:carnitine CoA-transferase CaiB-like acyl-CoA transferase